MRLEDEIVTKKFPNEFHKLTINLYFSGNWVIAQNHHIYNEVKITSQQFNLLRILRGQYPKAATIGLLRDRLVDKMADASRLVDRLHQKGLVTRNENEHDRRKADVLITDKGLDLLLDLDNRMKKPEEILNLLTEKEVKLLNDLLDKMRG